MSVVSSPSELPNRILHWFYSTSLCDWCNPCDTFLTNQNQYSNQSRRGQSSKFSCASDNLLIYTGSSHWFFVFWEPLNNLFS